MLVDMLVDSVRLSMFFQNGPGCALIGACALIRMNMDSTGSDLKQRVKGIFSKCSFTESSISSWE